MYSTNLSLLHRAQIKSLGCAFQISFKDHHGCTQNLDPFKVKKKAIIFNKLQKRKKKVEKKSFHAKSFCRF